MEQFCKLLFIHCDISLFTERATELYSEAMRYGCVNRRIIKCLIIGAPGVGKTTIKHLLLNEELPLKRESTGLMENPARAVSVARIGVQNKSWFIVDSDEKLMKIMADAIASGDLNHMDMESMQERNCMSSEETEKGIHSEFIEAVNKATAGMTCAQY